MLRTGHSYFCRHSWYITAVVVSLEKEKSTFLSKISGFPELWRICNPFFISIFQNLYRSPDSLPCCASSCCRTFDMKLMWLICKSRATNIQLLKLFVLWAFSPLD